MEWSAAVGPWEWASKWTRPVSAGISPASDLSSVDLPAPLGPSKPTHRPQRNSRLRWCNAGTRR